MVDLDILGLSVAVIDSQGGVSAQVNCKSIMELIDRVKKSEKDAARYRWLRDRAFKNDILSLLASHPSEWDEMVDEATQSEQRQ